MEKAIADLVLAKAPVDGPTDVVILGSESFHESDPYEIFSNNDMTLFTIACEDQIWK